MTEALALFNGEGISTILIALLAISEALALIPSFKSNSILNLVANSIEKILPWFKSRSE